MAGIFTSNFEQGGRPYSVLSPAARYERDNIPHILESYHYIKKGSYVKKIRRENKKVFLDSGAFSDFTLGKKTDLNAYARFIAEHQDMIECASVLDAIGSAHGTYENQLELEKKGCNVLPCFHYGEDIQYLEYYLANYDHMTIGGMVPISSPQLKVWLDDIWDRYLTDGSGNPRIKIHGFGLTAQNLMERYPWYSVDSSVWVQAARIGELCFPHWKRVQVSDKSDQRKDAGKHLWTMAEMEADAVREYIDQRGYDPDELSARYQERWAFNCGTYNIVNQQHDDDTYTPFVAPNPGIFPC